MPTKMFAGQKFKNHSLNTRSVFHEILHKDSDFLKEDGLNFYEIYMICNIQVENATF